MLALCWHQGRQDVQCSVPDPVLRPKTMKNPWFFNVAGPAPVSSPEAFGGNRRLYAWTPLPPTHLVLTSYLPRTYSRPTIIVVIYSVFCVWCLKNIVFYRVLWPSPSPGFILATLKNYGFFVLLGRRKGSGTENWTS